jgi:hypothetical protein
MVSYGFVAVCRAATPDTLLSPAPVAAPITVSRTRS